MGCQLRVGMFVGVVGRVTSVLHDETPCDYAVENRKEGVPTNSLDRFLNVLYEGLAAQSK